MNKGPCIGPMSHVAIPEYLKGGHCSHAVIESMSVCEDTSQIHEERSSSDFGGVERQETEG